MPSSFLRYVRSGAQETAALSVNIIRAPGTSANRTPFPRPRRLLPVTTDIIAEMKMLKKICANSEVSIFHLPGQPPM